MSVSRLVGSLLKDDIITSVFSCSGCRTSRSQPFFIGVAGGTASGKTTVCDAIMQKLGDQVALMSALWLGRPQESIAY